MEEMHLATPFLLAECRNQRLQLRACRVNVVAIQCVGYPFESRCEARRLDGTSTQPHDTLAIRSHAAIVFSARTRGRKPRSDGSQMRTFAFYGTIR
jgi:hypothetical protein